MGVKSSDDAALAPPAPLQAGSADHDCTLHAAAATRIAKPFKCAAGTAVIVQSRAGAGELRLERWRAPAPGEPAASGAGADAAGAAWAPCAAHAVSAGAEDADAAAPMCFAADGSMAAVGRGALLAGDGLQVCGRLCWAPTNPLLLIRSILSRKGCCEAQCCSLPLMLALVKSLALAPC